MPNRWEGNNIPGDLTGNIGRELRKKQKAEIARRQQAYETTRLEILETIDQAKRPSFPVAYETWDDEDIIDYTGDYNGTPTY